MHGFVITRREALEKLATGKFADLDDLHWSDIARMGLQDAVDDPDEDLPEDPNAEPDVPEPRADPVSDDIPKPEE